MCSPGALPSAGIVPWQNSSLFLKRAPYAPPGKVSLTCLSITIFAHRLESFPPVPTANLSSRHDLSLSQAGQIAGCPADNPVGQHTAPQSQSSCAQLVLIGTSQLMASHFPAHRNAWCSALEQLQWGQHVPPRSPRSFPTAPCPFTPAPLKVNMGF